MNRSENRETRIGSSGLVSTMNKDMTGLEFIQAMIDGKLPHNSMADTLGYRIVEAEKGRVVITATPNDTQLNPHGTGAWRAGRDDARQLHGARGHRPCSTRASARRRSSSRFLSFAPITPEIGPIRAEGKVVSPGRRVGTAEGRVTDAKGRLLVHGTTTCLILS